MWDSDWDLQEDAEIAETSIRASPLSQGGQTDRVRYRCSHQAHRDQQKSIVITYKGFVSDEPLRFDVLVEDCLLVEAKSVERVLPIHKAQLLSYMKLMNVLLGLLINFHESKLTDGVSRLILPGADS